MHGNSRDQAIGRRHRVKVRRGGAEHDLTLVVAPRAMQKRVLQVHEAPARSSAGA